MEPIKLTLTDAGKLTGDVPLPSGAADVRPEPHAGDRDLRPEEVVWSGTRADFEGRSLPASSLFPSGITSVGDGGSC